jgi:hypothetical protein
MTRYLIAAIAVLGLLLTLQTWRLDGVQIALVKSKAEAVALAKRLDAADREAQVTADQCAARVEAARQSARAIERIIERPVYVDPQGCAVRGIVGADELRDALQPISPAAQPVH